MSRLQSVGEVAGLVLRRVLLDPVRTGRLRHQGWPAGLGPVVGIGLGVYALGLVGAVLGGRLRSVLAHDSPDGFPPALFPVMITMVIVVVALVCTGCLHAPWPLTLVGLALALVVEIGIAGWTRAWWSIVVQLAAWALLAAFTLLRRQQTFAWWEFLVVQAILGTSVGLAAWLGLRPQLDDRHLDVSDLAALLLISVTLFALPTAMTAGLAVTEVAFTTSVWVGETVSVRVRPAVVTGLTAVLAAVAVSAVAGRWWRSALPAAPHLISTAAAAVLLATTWALWWTVDRVGHRANAGNLRVSQLVPPARRVAVVVSILATLPVMLSTAMLLVQLGFRLAAEAVGTSVTPNGTVGLPDVGVEVLRGSGSLLATVVAAALTVFHARRGNRGPAELYGLVAVLSGIRGVGQLGWVPLRLSLDDLSAVAVLTVVAAAGSWAVRGGLTSARFQAVLVTLLIGLAISERELLADPLGWLLGGTAGALLAFGLVWNLLTGAEEANEDSDGFPRSARALLVVANLALAMTVFAYDQLVVGTALELDAFVTEGADVIGTGLLVTGLWVVLRAGVTDDEGSLSGSTVSGDPSRRR